jgi:hypothetical protein
VALYRVIAFSLASWDRGWLHKLPISFNSSVDNVTDYDICEENLILVGLSRNLKAVTRTTVLGIHSEVDSLAPHSLFTVVDVEAVLAVDLSRLNRAATVPQSQALGLITRLHLEAPDFLLILSPKVQILNRENLQDLTISRFTLIELRNNILPKLTGLVDFTCL